MPELPEVETVVRGVKPLLEKHKIIDLKLLSTKLRYLIPKNLRKQILNSKIEKVQRKAKYILFFLDNQKIIVIHLGMTGRLLYKKKDQKEKNLETIFKNRIKKLSKHDHIIFFLENGASLIFNDVRKFGMLDLIKAEEINDYKFFQKLGLEPLEKDFSKKTFEELLSKRNKSIKSTIMDASLIVGIGNIYANEALFRSAIHPERIASDLKPKEAMKLRQEIIKVLKEAIKAGGSTLKDFANEKGESGYFQFDFLVYGRDEQGCKKCKSTIERIKQNGRSSFFCPQCQS